MNGQRFSGCRDPHLERGIATKRSSKINGRQRFADSVHRQNF
jgi:hypothetical protein